jgi:predicted DNA-binding transcriptional regulator YafY
MHTRHQSQTPPSSRRSFLAAFASLLLAPMAMGKGNARAEAPHRLPPDDLPDDPAQLRRWQRARRRALTRSSHPLTRQLLTSISARSTLVLHYYGGSQPGARRTLSPRRLHTVEGFTGSYLVAWCHHRRSERTFRIEKLSLEPRDYA